MFESARLKLTAWYLLIIMFISMLFSVAFYNASTREIQRVIRRLQYIQNQLNTGIFFIAPPLPNVPTVQELQESEYRLILVLVFINTGIVLLAGGAGYFLAGRTLKPIKEMVDEQNRFIADASHELRTPLTALRSEMEASLFEKQMRPKDVKALIKSNLEEVMHLQLLSDNLLQLAHYQNQNTKYTLKDISLLQVVENALKRITPIAKRKRILINNEINDVTLVGDAHSLTELFVILLDNAIKYSEPEKLILLSSKKKRQFGSYFS